MLILVKNSLPPKQLKCLTFQGVPVRIEIGPRDVRESQVTLVRRHSGAKEVVAAADFARKVVDLLDEIHEAMLEGARRQLEGGIRRTSDWGDFVEALDRRKLLLSPFCGGVECEEAIKRDSRKEEGSADPGAPSMGAKTLCVPARQPEGEDAGSLRCIRPDCREKPKFFTLFGRSY